MSDVRQENEVDLMRGLTSLSPTLPESKTQELDDALFSQLRKPAKSEISVTKFSFRAFLRQTLIGTTCATAICGAFLLTSLKASYTPPKSEMKPRVTLIAPPVSLDLLLREPSTRAASLWRRGSVEPDRTFSSRKAMQDDRPSTP